MTEESNGATCVSLIDQGPRRAFRACEQQALQLQPRRRHVDELVLFHTLKLFRSCTSTLRCAFRGLASMENPSGATCALPARSSRSSPAALSSGMRTTGTSTTAPAGAHPPRTIFIPQQLACTDRATCYGQRFQPDIAHAGCLQPLTKLSWFPDSPLPRIGFPITFQVSGLD